MIHPAKHHLLRVAFAAVSLCAIPAGNALAGINPYLLKMCKPDNRRGLFEALVRPIHIAVRNRIYLTADGPLANGALVGYVDVQDPTKSQLAAAFPFIGDDTWTFKLSAGIWVDVAGRIASLSVAGTQDTRNPSLPFARPGTRNQNSTYTYNGLMLYGAETPTIVPKEPPIGTQVLDNEAKSLIAGAIAKNQPFDLGMMTAYHPDFVANWNDDDGFGICRGGYGYMLHLLHVQSTGYALDVEPISGRAEVTQGHMLAHVPDACTNRGDRMECPIDVKTNTVSGGFTLKLDTIAASDAWLLVDGRKTRKIDVSELNRTTLVVTARYLSDLLGSKDVTTLDDVALTIVPNQMPQLTSPLSLLSNVELKRLTFGVAIEERNPPALGHYTGSIGQDPDIVIPLTVRQFGASKATRVSVEVKAPSVSTAQGPRCKFVGNRGATVVGIPANLRFYSGTEHIDRADNCTGLTHDVTSMKWREAIGGNYPYMGSLDMDLIFPLSPSGLHLDVAGNIWVGKIEASGDVVVKGEWK